MNIIEVKALSKSYGNVKALDNVSLSVAEGTIFGLIGPDGAGKTTLYRILTTLLLPDAGTAVVDGADIVHDYRRIRAGIGYMPERFSLYTDFTVKENLEFFASLFGVRVADNYDLIAPIFSQLARFPDRMAGALSGGMKQKLALSCALIHRPRILLLDEPTTGVDAVSRSEFWDMLATLKGRGMTILVSTPYMDEARRCDRIALMNGGRILETDTPEKLVQGLGRRIFSAVSEDMYRLLQALRTLPDVEKCYTFGATLHIVARETFRPETVTRQLDAMGLSGVAIRPAKGDIEDLFIKLADDE